MVACDVFCDDFGGVLFQVVAVRGTPIPDPPCSFWDFIQNKIAGGFFLQTLGVRATQNQSFGAIWVCDCVLRLRS